MPADAPRFTHDGAPANLPAAALDGVEWLEIALHNPQALACVTTTGRAKLARACRALREYLGECGKPEWEEAPRKFPEAVAQIVDLAALKAERARGNAPEEEA